MANSCIGIENVPRAYKEWKVEAKKKLEEAGLPSTDADVEKIWVDGVVKNDKSGVMAYIAHPDRGVKTRLNFGKGKHTEVMVLGATRADDGTITVAISGGKIDATLRFDGKSAMSMPTKNTKRTFSMPIMDEIDKQASAMDGISEFGGAYTVLSKAMNQKVSYYLFGVIAEKSGGVIGSLIQKGHNKASEMSPMYKETTSLVADGYRDSVMLNKIKVMMNLKGDVDQMALSDVLNVGHENARRTQEVLDTHLPKLDKWIEKEVRSKKDREKLDEILGRSGFMHLLDNPEIIAAINNGETDPVNLFKYVEFNGKQMEEAVKLKAYLVDGEVEKGTKPNAGGSKTVEQLAALLALQEDGGLNTLHRLRTSSPKLYVELLKMVGMVKSLNEVVHEGKRNRVGEGSGKVYTGYDGNGILDIYDGGHEYAYVTEKDLNGYLKDPRWIVLREPKGNDLGVLARESSNSYQTGIGLDKNVIRNGIEVESEYVQRMVKAHGPDWLVDNNVLADTDSGYVRYRIILKKEEKAKNKAKKNVAHTLYRTWVHNAQLVEMNTVQKLVSEQMVELDLNGLDKLVKRNRKRKEANKEEVKPFISTKMTYDEMKEEYPELYKMYTPVKNISNYGMFSDKVSYVRKDMEDVLIGYPQGSLFSDSTQVGVTLQRAEKVYKELVQMLKLKMVVANLPKLAMDIVSNSTMLLTMDVSITDIKNGYTEAMDYAAEMSALEGELVVAKLDRAKAEAMGRDLVKLDARVDRVEKKIKEHPFYAAVKNGFIQSQGTSMLQKEYDTITGLQNSIDALVEKIVKDKKGEPNKVHDALVWLMNAGYGVDDTLDAITNMSKVKGTSIGQELNEISDRLKSKKKRDVIKDEESRLGRKLTKDEIRDIQRDADTVRYVSEFIGAPSSEVVRQGSRIMQMGDIAAKWTLYLHEVRGRLEAEGLKYEGKKGGELLKAINADVKAGKLSGAKWKSIEKEAGLVAMQAFIDYRQNMPQELKVLSDYGILLFPAFWMRAQRVIWALAKHHPVNMAGGVLVTDLLGISGATITDAFVGNKIMNGSILHGGQDVLSPRTLILGY